MSKIGNQQRTSGRSGTKSPALLASSAALAIGLSVGAARARAALVIGFDDLPTSSVAAMPSSYDYFNWSNFYTFNGSSATAVGTGATVADVSPTNSIFDVSSKAGDMNTGGTFAFNLTSLDMTALFDDGVAVTVNGTGPGGVSYTDVLHPSATAPTLYTLNFNGITDVTFTIASVGTQHAGYSGSSGQFLLDNLTVSTSDSAVPEPTGVAVLVSTVGLLVGRRRRQM